MHPNSAKSQYSPEYERSAWLFQYYSYIPTLILHILLLEVLQPSRTWGKQIARLVSILSEPGLSFRRKGASCARISSSRKSPAWSLSAMGLRNAGRIVPLVVVCLPVCSRFVKWGTACYWANRLQGGWVGLVPIHIRYMWTNLISAPAGEPTGRSVRLPRLPCAVWDLRRPGSWEYS